MQKLLINGMREKLLANGAAASETGETADSPVLKIFDANGRYTFYVFEAMPHDGDDLSLYGFCVSPMGPDCDEWGSVLLSEIEALQPRMQRDVYFAGCTKADIAARKYI